MKLLPEFDSQMIIAGGSSANETQSTKLNALTEKIRERRGGSPGQHNSEGPQQTAKS